MTDARVSKGNRMGRVANDFPEALTNNRNRNGNRLRPPTRSRYLVVYLQRSPVARPRNRRMLELCKRVRNTRRRSRGTPTGSNSRENYAIRMRGSRNRGEIAAPLRRFSSLLLAIDLQAGLMAPVTERLRSTRLLLLMSCSWLDPASRIVPGETTNCCRGG